jgi:penicillin G amidase
LTSAKAFLKKDIDPVWLMRIFTAIPVALILIAGVGALWIYFFVVSLLPDSEAIVQTPGLITDVRVLRDQSGVPGIIGENEEDVAMVLGYVMAQDRLWQMDYLRKAGQGRLAEILGAEYLEGDHLMRTVRAGKLAEDAREPLGERERRWLEKFVQGINKYISAHARKLPVEFSLLDYRPAPFSPQDVSSILAGLAWESSIAARVDPILTRLVARLGKDRALQLFPTDPGAAAAFVPTDLGRWDPNGILFPRPGSSRIFDRVPGLRGGCAWTVGSGKSQSGKPMAACTVYQTLTAPGFWYKARLAAGEFHLSGTFIPGVPVAIAGTNDYLGWGCVPGLVDDADLFLERLESDSPTSYWRVDRWRKLEEQKENYRIKGGSVATRVIRMTETGPLVSEVDKGRALSLSWTGREALGFFPALYSLNRARNRAEFEKSLSVLIAPCLNVAWADREADFGIQFAGKVPLRPPGSDGILPMPAWTGTHDWRGFVPFKELPAWTNPSEGYCVAADGRPGGKDYPFFVSCYWYDTDKSARIKELLEESDVHQPESFQRIQCDFLSPLARDFVPILLNSFKGNDKRNQSEDQAARILGTWDFQMGGDSAAAAIFGLFYQALVEELFLEPLGESLYAGFTGYPPLASRAVKRIFIEDQTGWIESVNPQELLKKSFQKAVARGQSLMGSEPKKWKWGEIHTAEFRHPLAVRSKFLEALYQVGPIPISGASDTINFAGWSQAHPFHVPAGMSLRQVVDMTQPAQVAGASPMGASAHFFSPHYKDQTRAWLSGRSFRDPVLTADIRKSAFSTVIFKAVPAGSLSLK